MTCSRSLAKSAAAPASPICVLVQNTILALKLESSSRAAGICPRPASGYPITTASGSGAKIAIAGLRDIFPFRCQLQTLRQVSSEPPSSSPHLSASSGRTLGPDQDSPALTHSRAQINFTFLRLRSFFSWYMAESARLMSCSKLSPFCHCATPTDAATLTFAGAASEASWIV